MMNAKNARFWVWWQSGPVKITLRPGQRLTACYGGLTDEGWHHHSETWELAADEPVVYCECLSEGQDCDGRLDRHWKGSCPVDDLAAGGINEEHDIAYPAWQQGSRCQRDYAAEAAGY